MHALIIEDEPMIALLIEDHLRGFGYDTVAFATTESEAVGAAERQMPDLITSDVRLTEGCGIAAVAQICNAHPIPVVYITASAGDVREQVQDAIVVQKPFGALELERALIDTRAIS